MVKKFLQNFFCPPSTLKKILPQKFQNADEGPGQRGAILLPLSHLSSNYLLHYFPMLKHFV